MAHSSFDSTDELTDEQLLARLRDGDREWFGTLVRRYERELYGYLRRYLGDAELAADVFQNTFVAVFTKIQQYELGRPARPWLYAIATNQAIDSLRKQKRRVERTTDPLPMGGDDASGARPLFELLASREPDPAELAVSDELSQQVRGAVDQLSDLHKQVVVLSYFQGFKYQDIAEVLGVPLGTVKSRLNSAMAKLTEIWMKSAATGGLPE